MGKEMKEDLDFEIGFYERIIKDKPDFVDVLIPLGDAYTKKGLYDKGLEVDKKLSVLLPDDAVVWYNLACSLSLLSHIEESLESLEKAIKLGYREFTYMLKDSDLDNIKKDKRFEEMLKKFQKGKRRKYSYENETGDKAC